MSFLTILSPRTSAARPLLRPVSPSRGFTLTEIAIVLGIVGLVLGAIWSASTMVYANRTVNKAVTQLQIIVNGVRALYPNGAFDADIAGGSDITTLLYNNGVYPSDMPMLTGFPVSPWGGHVKTAVSPSCGGTWTRGACGANTFTVQFTNDEAGVSVPCELFVSRVIGTGGDPKLIALWLGGSGIGGTGSTGFVDAATLKLSAIPTTCDYVGFFYSL